MTNHSLIVASPMAPPCASQLASQSPYWLQVIQATGAIATTVGVLIALYIAIIREPREASAVHKHHVAQMDALRRVRRDRFGAQARKLVSSCAKLPMFGDSWWTVRIDNTGNALATILAVKVTAVDTNGFEITGGCRQANNTTPVDQYFDRSVLAALSGSSESGLERPLNGAVKQVIRDAVTGHVVREWPRTLPPNQYAVMAYTTTDPNYKLAITIDYEDEAGFQWRRTNAGQPTLADEAGGVDLATTNKELW